MKQNIYLLAAAVLGLWLSVTFIHPDPAGYTITRSILQLSGSRGIFSLEVTLTVLLQFAQRLNCNGKTGQGTAGKNLYAPGKKQGGK